MLSAALAEWRQVCEPAPMDKHPTLWVGHYADTKLLGAIHSPRPKHIADLILILASPFCVATEVTDCVIIMDRPGWLAVAHLYWSSGVYSETWKIPYSRDDYGHISFAEATRVSLTGRVNDAVNSVAEHRLTGHPLDDAFNEAYWFAVHAGKNLL